MPILDQKWISYPDVMGFEWANTYEDFPKARYEHQLVWLRRTTSVHYGTRVRHENPDLDNTQWVNTSVVSPERFGFDGTEAGFEKLVEEFLRPYCSSGRKWVEEEKT